ncbi:MAG: aminoglycoside phosphotransferase family protein, partial [Polyangiaceae bacterium]|nr:aminoglycoside phosphotransferase family protein [Polyangiaceae bacterium]
EPFVSVEGTWRLLSFVEGCTFTEVDSTSLARVAGALAGRFHGAVSGFAHRFAFTREGAHDTARHLGKLAGLLDTHEVDEETRSIAEAILAHGRSLAPLPATRRRIVHGDLKITNLLFSEAGDEGLALVDLDTMAYGTLPVELGDALRSWSNPRGESEVDTHCDPAIVEAALEGFVEGAQGDVDAAELLAVPLGIETIATELASRFAADAIEDCYFGWESARFDSRAHHNRVRALSQLALAGSVARQKDDLDGISRRLLR